MRRLQWYKRGAAYTYREIAEELNLSEKTVEHHISKALKTLRGKKDDFLADFFYILPFIHGGIL